MLILRADAERQAMFEALCEWTGEREFGEAVWRAVVDYPRMAAATVRLENGMEGLRERLDALEDSAAHAELRAAFERV